MRLVRTCVVSCRHDCVLPFLYSGIAVVTAIKSASPSVSVSSLPSNGGSLLYLVGTNFGPAQASSQLLQSGAVPPATVFLEAVSYGPTGSEYTTTVFSAVNHTHILVETVPGVGAGLVFTVVVAGQSSSPSVASISYGVPTILSISPAFADTVTDAGVTCTLVGRDFGLLVRRRGPYISTPVCL